MSAPMQAKGVWGNAAHFVDAVVGVKEPFDLGIGNLFYEPGGDGECSLKSPN